MPDMVIYSFGDIVYHKTCPEDAGIVSGFIFRPGGVTYLVTWPNMREVAHYDFELTDKEFASV